MSAMAEPAPVKLPVWRTVGESYAIWFKELPELIRISWVWLLIIAPIVALFMWWQAPAMMEMMLNARAGRPDPQPGTILLTEALNWIILLPILSSIAVAWHRLLLRGEHVSGTYLRLDSVVVGYAMLFFLIAMLPSGISFALTQSAGATKLDVGASMVSGIISILSLVALFFACRLLMVLPAKALGRDISFGAAWAGTRKNSWRLYWGYMLCLLPFVGILIGVWLMLAQSSRTVTASVWTVLTLLGPVFGMVSVGFLSLAYRHFFERPA